MKASHRAWARFSAVGVLVVASAGAFAQGASEPGRGKEAAAELKKRFAAADVNHDGRLTREEAKAGMPGVYDNFDQIDTAKTGSVSMAEIAAFLRARGAARKAGG
ncbi:MAG TPA: EF-hand domain-containing protein [Caldimonas sp.]